MNLQPLTEATTEQWHTPGACKPVSLGKFSGHDSDDYAYLQACLKVSDLGRMRTITEQLYRELLALAENLGKPRFVRIWNYIPHINAGDGDNECYRQFCWGRADALGKTVLPAATGIGSRDGWLRIGALCTTPSTREGGQEAGGKPAIQITHLENPRQLSAYHYPREYGPRSPSFARATLVQSSPAAAGPDSGPGLLLLSGTASIVHHETRHAGNFQRQYQETVTNINALLSTLKQPTTPVAMRYYLRDTNYLQEAIDCWSEHFPAWPKPAVYAADICRVGLELEIEGVFSV